MIYSILLAISPYMVCEMSFTGQRYVRDVIQTYVVESMFDTWSSIIHPLTVDSVIGRDRTRHLETAVGLDSRKQVSSLPQRSLNINE
jgi:hypothetical protein